MNRLFAIAWLVVIGSNGAQYYSQEAPYQGAIILAGTAYFLIVFCRKLLGLVFFKDYLLVVSIFALPLLLMLLSDRSFDRGAYTSQISVLLVFAVASVLAVQADFDLSLSIAGFVIVAVGAALNLYELLVANNTWSISPGRSGGFYVNPNLSSEALLGYGLICLTVRMGTLRIIHLILMALVVCGVFATFSRAGILASLLLLTAAALMRVRRESMMRILCALVVISVLTFWFASYVVANLDLSQDAAVRIDSLLHKGGVGDYAQDRGNATDNALDVIAEYPVLGAGVNTIYDMGEGPHNMFLAVMVDYGLFGLIVYLVLLIRLVMIARRANRDMSGLIWLFGVWLIFFSFTSHNLLGNLATIPLFGIALARAYRIQSTARRSELTDAFAR
jgi:O-Antigen ligase